MPRTREHDEAEYALRDLLYAIAQQVHDRRTSLGWSQGDLAQQAGTRQPHISRLESARNLPSLDLLLRVANAMDTDLTVTFTPRQQQGVSGPVQSHAGKEHVS
ncbi:helix-turn-helix transcriptional regulator [Streptomyces roseifaciens]